jgi:capsule polysaccharide export protein KpsE/RkpR
MTRDTGKMAAQEGRTRLMADPVANADQLSLEMLGDSSNHNGPAEERADRERFVGKLRLLWNQRRILLRITGAALVLSTLIAFVIPKRYESTARLMPPNDTNSGMALLAAVTGGKSASGSGGGLTGGLGGGLGSVASDLLGMKSSGALFVGILQSRTVQDDLINKFDLRKLYRDRLVEDAREDLGKKTDITEDRKSGIISIQVTDKNPQRAAAMAQEYVEELKRLLTQVNTSSAHRERVFLEERLAQVKQDLESAEKGFSEFASKNTAIDIQSQGKAMIEAGAALEGQMIAAQTELQSLRQIYSDGNIRVRTTQARVNELQRQLEKLSGKFDSVTTSNGQADQMIYPSIRKLPLLGVNYADLYRNTKIQEAIFETLTQGYELAKVEEAKETPNVKVIDPPNVPEKKSFPPRPLIIILGALLPCFLGAFWILGNARWMEIDQQDPGKVFAQEIFKTMAAHLPSASNGSSISPPKEGSNGDLPGRNGSTSENKEGSKPEE